MGQPEDIIRDATKATREYRDKEKTNGWDRFDDILSIGLWVRMCEILLIELKKATK